MTDVPNWVLLACILMEWGYVVYWTRTAGKKFVANILRAFRLRRGRAGASPSPIEEMEAGLEGGGDAAGGEEIDGLIDAFADRLGVPPERLAGLAQTFLGKAGGEPGAAGPLMTAGGMDPKAAMLSELLQGFATGRLKKDDAIQMGIPLVVNWLANQKGAASGAPGPSSDSYWG